MSTQFCIHLEIARDKLEDAKEALYNSAPRAETMEKDADTRKVAMAVIQAIKALDKLIQVEKAGELTDAEIKSLDAEGV